MKNVKVEKNRCLIYYYKISLIHYTNLKTMKHLIEKINKLFGGESESEPIPHKEKEHHKLEKLRHEMHKYMLFF